MWPLALERYSASIVLRVSLSGVARPGWCTSRICRQHNSPVSRTASHEETESEHTNKIPRSPSTTAAFLVGCVALQQHANLAGHAPRLTVSLGTHDDVGASSAGCPAVSLIVANRIYPIFRSRSLLFPTGSPAHFFHRHVQEERTPRVRNASQGDGRLTIWRRARSLLVMNLRGLMVTVPLEDILPAKTGLSAPTLRRAPARQGSTAGGDGGPSPLALPRSHNTTQHERCSKPPSAFFSPPKHARCAPRVTAAAWQPRFWLPCGL